MVIKMNEITKQEINNIIKKGASNTEIKRFLDKKLEEIIREVKKNDS